MKTPGVIDGIIVAVLLALGAAATNLVLGGFLNAPALYSLILAGSVLIYLVYLLKRSEARIGRVVVISTWALISISCWVFEVGLLEQVFIQAGIVWLVRSLYFHASVFAAVLDFALVSAGLAAGGWAVLNTGSFAAALWSFFLAQSLFCCIGDLARKQGNESAVAESDYSSFQSAHRVALDAVRKLTQP